MQRLRFDDLGLEALALGEGRTTLLLHGFPDLPTSWVEVASQLSGAGLRCVLPYMPGYPPSATQGPYDVDTLGDRVAALAAALGGPAHLVGHDWGSAVAQAAVTRHPERFDRLVLMSVPHVLAFLRNALVSPRQLQRSRYMAFFQLPWWPERRVREPAAIAAIYRRWSNRPVPAAHVEEVAAALARSGGAPLQYYRENLRPSAGLLRRLLRTGRTPITAPTLYLHGADDDCIAPAIARGQRRFFAGPFRSHLVPAAGHFLQLDAPRDVAQSCAQWLTEES